MNALQNQLSKINDYIDIQKGIIKLADISIKELNFENDDDSDDDDSDDGKIKNMNYCEVCHINIKNLKNHEKSNKHKIKVDIGRIKELQRCRNGEQQNLCFINADTDRIKELLDVKFFNKENIEEFENHLKTLIGYISLVKYLLNLK